jgi:hypothetical protein
VLLLLLLLLLLLQWSLLQHVQLPTNKCYQAL